MPRVALFCEYETVSGGERSALATLSGLGASGWQVVAVTPGRGELSTAFERAGIETVAWVPSRRETVAPSEREAAIECVLRRLPCDLLHANSLSMARLTGPIAARLGIPSIGHLRDILRLSPRAIACLNRHTRLLAVSHATRDFHIAQGVEPSRCHVQYNGVDLMRFAPRPPSGWLHRELGLDPSTRLIGSIGQIGLRKGLDTLLAAASPLVTCEPSAHILVIGSRWSEKDESRHLEEQLREACNKPPLAGRVHWLGYRNDVHRVLNELTLLAHAARQEPLGRVLLEAAASGTAVVATDVGGTREIFPEPTMAKIVPPDDPQALCNAMLEVLDSPRLRETLQSAARQRAEAAFDMQAAALALASHYKQVAATGLAPSRPGHGG